MFKKKLSSKLSIVALSLSLLAAPQAKAMGPIDLEGLFTGLVVAGAVAGATVVGGCIAFRRVAGQGASNMLILTGLAGLAGYVLGSSK